MNTNFKVIGLTRVGIEFQSTALEGDALTTQLSELLKKYCIVGKILLDLYTGHRSLG